MLSLVLLLDMLLNVEFFCKESGRLYLGSCEVLGNAYLLSLALLAQAGALRFYLEISISVSKEVFPEW